jgi:ABC-2 type transport system permease protein
MFLGIFPFILMFVVTSITTLRERTNGTLERLMTTPMGKLDFLFGYGLAFSILALVQGLVTSAITLSWLGVTVQGGTVRVLIFVILGGLAGETLGLFMSAFATSEFQAVQFMPALIFPQLLTSGIFVPRDGMAKLLQWFADVMPLTYLVDALKHVTTDTGWSHDLTKDALILGAYIVGALVLGTLTLRRSSK